MSKLEIHASQVAAYEGARIVLEKLGWKQPFLGGYVDIWEDRPNEFSVFASEQGWQVLVVVNVDTVASFRVPVAGRFVGGSRYGDRYLSFQTDPVTGITSIA